MSKYAEIIERLEKATGADEALDADICIALQYGGENSEGAQNVRANEDWPGDILFEVDEEECCNKTPALTASIDAALSLVERMLPGHCLSLNFDNRKRAYVYKDDEYNIAAKFDEWVAYADAEAMPLAILLALFRALEGKEPRHER